jgi:hypothetical protein
MTDPKTNNETLPDEISVTWHIMDVQEIRPDLTDDQARQVLQRADRCHDANVGISWEVLAYLAWLMFGDGPDEEESDKLDGANPEGGAA